MRKIQLLVLSVLLLLVSWSNVKSMNKENKIDNINAIMTVEYSIVVDGDLSDWDNDYFVKGLTNPWNDNVKDETLFDFKVIDDQFYFYFKTLDNTLTIIPFKEEMSVAAGDRVELFFSSNKRAQNYYCAEMDPNGKVLDYNAEFYRIFDNEWDFKTLLLSTEIIDEGYIVEGKISIKELQELGFGDALYLGVFRADYQGLEIVDWYTKTIPDAKKPDFHLPSAFERISLK